ncbi:MAG: hypothetical protein D3X82_09340 [Candidatus Leucobacter sulfamidivorax]|nr:hypothetical protein [Candidatus Leucobacter sulfamidivorax]
MRKPATTIATSALVIFAALGLTGCVGQIESAIRQGAESAIEDATSENGIDVDLGDGAKVPDGWPASVPVPSGEILLSGTAEGGFSLIMTADQVDIDGIIEEMKSAGFSEQSNMGVAEGRMVVLQNAEWNVGLIYGEDADSGKMSLMYTLTPVK